jgi:Primase C terminal 2 (PriCT-2)/Bifunctional DNA primase/polymerase, N-terminal
MNTRELLCRYEDHGWSLVPVPAGLKGAALKDWPNRRFGLADFGNGENVAIKLRRRSAGLVDVDLDCEEAIELADLYLPQTGATFGRPSKPRSHRLYVAPGATFETFADPVARATLLELRADGRDGGAHLTLVPPSIADGERREWCDAIEPATVDHRVLRLCVARLAIGSLVLRYVSEHAARRPGPDLPRILWEFDHELGRPTYRWLAKPDPDAPQQYPRRRAEQDPHDIDLAEIVKAIPNDCDWHEWNRIGMAIFAASKDRGDGQVIFDDFSAKSPKYDPHAVEERWRNFRRSPPTRIGMGTLVHLARQAGWNPARAS